jgi:hypothetical protein
VIEFSRFFWHPKLGDSLKPRVLKNIDEDAKKKLYDLHEGFF